MSDLGRVLVLAGGLSFEREVSLHSGRRVADALRRVGVDVVERDVDRALLPSIAADPPAAVFLALHGSAGEDGTVREVLDLLGLPYVGASPAACRIAFDKPAAKDRLADAEVSVPDGVALSAGTFRDLGAAALLERIVARLGLPVVVKPARGGSALGTTVVRASEELPSAMVACFSYGDVAVIERYVAGVEVAVSVVDAATGPVALPAVEIVPDGGMFDYAARYTAGATEYFTPARLSSEAAASAAVAALRSHETLGLRDLSRVDLIVEPDGTVTVLEVNVAPGMTETSLLPMAAEAAGHDLGALCRDLLASAVARGPDTVARVPHGAP